MISHEIRTPLAGIIGHADLLTQSELTAPQRQHTDTITSAARGLLGILNDILDFSKLESGKLQFSMAAVSLPGIIRDVEAALVPSLRAGKMRLEVHVAADMLSHVRGDELRLRQVIRNLLSNAIKFSDSGTIRVYLARKITEAGPVAHLAVVDQGIGIAAEDSSRLFSAFTQVDALLLFLAVFGRIVIADCIPIAD